MNASTIYINPGGWEVREFSHSQYQSYKFCPKKFQWERIFGWKQKQGAGMDFGKAIETGVKAIYQSLDPVEQFELQWAGAKENEKLVYKDGESWEWFHAAGVGLMTKFKSDWRKFPPRQPVFPGYKNSLKIKDERSGKIYQTIPDLIDHDERGEFIADVKAMGNLLDDSLPGLVVMDMQLRTQAAVHYRFSPNKTWRVALWNFCTKPKRVDAPSVDEIRSTVREMLGSLRFQQDNMFALFVAHEVNESNYDEAGKFLGIENNKEVLKEFKLLAKADDSVKPLALEIIEKINSAHRPQYVIQWLEGTMTEEHANEALREELSIVPLVQQNYFPRAGGMRFPSNQCTWCSHRGLCMEELCGPREEYTQITNAELVRFDEGTTEGWD